MPPDARADVAEKSGLNLEAVRLLLSKTHNAAIPENDPLLMVVTILNAYLEEVQKLHARHEKGLGKLMAEKTDDYVAGVNSAVEQLSASLSTASADGIRKSFDHFSSALHTFQSTMYWIAAVVALSALLNVAVFILRGLR
jgi:hypothetical protein